MAQPNFIPMPWAENGQKQDPIPAEQTSAGNGRASWKTGFPIENTRPVSNGGVPANYQDFQGVLHTLSEFACYQQAGGIFTWSDELDYEVGARVLGSDNNVYVATANSGPASVVTDPVGDTSGKWVTEPNITQASAAALEVASGFVTSGGYTINNGFTVTGGTINGQITSAQYASAIGNTSTNIGSAGIPVYVSGGVITPCDGVAVTSAAQTFSGEKTFTSVISGGVTGNAGTATRLQTARNIQTNLANTSAASFNGTANITPGVTGTLAIANGGTGVTAIADIQAGKDGAGNTITSTYATKADVAEEMATKADIDGNYPDMTVGNAEQLVSEDYITDTAPYTFRTAGGNVDIGDREYDELVGGTIAWNQLVSSVNLFAADSMGITATVTEGKTIVFSGTPTQENYSSFVRNISYINGHKYLVSGLYYNSNTVRYLRISLGDIVFPTSDATIVAANATGSVGAIYLYWYNNVALDFSWTPQIFDLTAMYGTAIADHVYALEQATPGAGVAWFRAHFPKDYYAYDPGSLQSVQAASHDMVGFNQWDEQWEAGGISSATGQNTNENRVRSKNYIPAFPDTGYFYSCNTGDYTGNLQIFFYDYEKNYLSYYNFSTTHSFTTPANTHFIKFQTGEAYGTTYHNDICINLSWSGYCNGEYEPYEKNTYPLDASLTLRGIPKLDASNDLYYDGDTYEADGTVTRRYAVKDLGTMTWYYNSSLQIFYSNTWGAGGTPVMMTTNLFCPNYKTMSGTNLQTGFYVTDKAICTGYIFAAGSVNIRDSSYTDAADFKAAMSGVYLVYELATPTTETADAFQTPQIVNDFGTEQYVDAAVAAGTRDVAIPVGHDTRYMSNLKDKLRRLPNMPDNAGTYLVDYNSATRRCSFTEYLDGAKITALESKIPDAPTTDGTYVLTCTVAEGEVTYTWESGS